MRDKSWKMSLMKNGISFYAGGSLRACVHCFPKHRGRLDEQQHVISFARRALTLLLVCDGRLSPPYPPDTVLQFCWVLQKGLHCCKLGIQKNHTPTCELG